MKIMKKKIHMYTAYPFKGSKELHVIDDVHFGGGHIRPILYSFF